MFELSDIQINNFLKHTVSFGHYAGYFYSDKYSMAKYKDISEELFKDHKDFFDISENLKDIYFSDGAMSTLLDFERCLDELGIYAFKNWELGELMSGPNIKPYTVSCIFMWPESMMPDPRGGRRLLPFDVTVKYKLTGMKMPVKINDPSDYRPGTHKAKLVDRKVWLVEIIMPKNLINDIRTGSVEIEDEEVDLQELEDSYAQDLDKDIGAGANDGGGDPTGEEAPAPGGM